MRKLVDVRIMAHPSRADNVYRMLKSLGLTDDIIIWDDREGVDDAMYTARKAWEFPIPEGCTHRLVLQDDAELCEDFLQIAEMAAARHADKVVSFMHEGSIEQPERYKRQVFSVGVALMMPYSMVKQFLDFVDNRLEWYTGPLYRNILRHDTTCMRYWMANTGVVCVTTVPSVVQHIGDESLVGNSGRRVSVDYTKNPPLTGW